MPALQQLARHLGRRADQDDAHLAHGRVPGRPIRRSPSEIDVVEPAALREPGGKPVTRAGAGSVRVRPASPPSPIAGKMKISSSGQLSASSRLSRTFANSPPLEPEVPGLRPRQPVADRLQSQILHRPSGPTRRWSRALTAADRGDDALDIAVVLEIRADHAVVVDPEMTGDLPGQCRLAKGGEAGQLALVPKHREAAGLRGEAVDPGQAAATRPSLQQPAVVAEMTIETALLQRAHAVADIVADPVSGVDERIVPIGVEQRRQRVRLVVIDERQRGVGAESVMREERTGAKNARRSRKCRAAGNAP